VTILDWPSQSPDLNLIENVWQTLNLAIDKRIPRIHSYQRLEEVVMEKKNRQGSRAQVYQEYAKKVCGSYQEPWRQHRLFTVYTLLYYIYLFSSLTL
jgi:hypothetical protein